MANELDEITGPINLAGNSNSNLTNFFGTTGLKTASKSFGIIGSAVLKKSNTPIAIVIANNNEAMTPQEASINKPLVKMIGVLASIDGVLKQRIENQKVIARNEQLAAREDIIENRNAEPHIEVIQPDAEKTSGSSMGLLALGGLALLTLDPVQEALKTVIDGVVSAGSFITSMVSSLNDVFSFLVGGNDTGVEPASETTPTVNQPAQTEQAKETGQAATPVIPAESEASGSTDQAMMLAGASLGSQLSTNQISSGTQSSPVEPTTAAPTAAAPAAPAPPPAAPPSPTIAQRAVTAVARTAITNPATGPVALAGLAALTAYNFLTNRSSSTDEQTQAVGIPRNETNNSDAIVNLGKHLQTQGINVSEHPAFGNVGGHTTNSRHYRGLAIDLNVQGPDEARIFDELEPQLRAAGYNTLWRTQGHETHMHVSVGGPEGADGGDYAGSLTQTLSSVATASLETVGKILGTFGSVLVKPGIPRTDVPRIIGEAARDYSTAAATARSESTVSLPSPPQPTGSVNTNAAAAPTTAGDINMTNVSYYHRRFGYSGISSQIATIAPAA